MSATPSVAADCPAARYIRSSAPLPGGQQHPASPRIRQYLDAACAVGIPARAVARAARIAPSTLSEIATGHIEPSDDVAARIAGALGRQVRDIFPGRS